MLFDCCVVLRFDCCLCLILQVFRFMIVCVDYWWGGGVCLFVMLVGVLA